MTDGGPNLKRFSMVPLRILPGTSGRRRNESQFRIKTHILRILDNMFSHTNAVRIALWRVGWRPCLNWSVHTRAWSGCCLCECDMCCHELSRSRDGKSDR